MIAEAERIIDTVAGSIWGTHPPRKEPIKEKKQPKKSKKKKEIKK